MSENKIDLTEKVAIVTGASRGIGYAIAETFALAGASVILASRKQADLDLAAKKIGNMGGIAFPFAAHAGEPEDINRLLNASVVRFGSVDILVNNAATNPHFGPILTSEESH